MISAAEARLMKPQFKLEEALAHIDTLVRATAAVKDHIDLPADLLPENGMGKWASGRPDDAGRVLEQHLTKLGYHITTDGGGHHGRGYVRLCW